MVEKLYKNIEESPQSAILQVLEDNEYLFLSAREIMSFVFEKYNINLSFNTIINNILSLQKINPNIISRIERRGEKKIPITVFSHYKINKENEYKSANDTGAN